MELGGWLEQLTVRQGLLWAGQAFLLLVFAGLFVDCVHWMLHRMQRSGSPLVESVGALHQVHHRFLGTELQFDDTLATQNLVVHRTGEFFTQLVGAAFGLLVLEPPPVVLASLAFSLAFAAGSVRGGKGGRHRMPAVVPAPVHGLVVGAAYHALHHRFPDRYLSSFTTLFDRLFATGCQVAGRTVALTGASGAFGAPLKALLEARGATVLPLKFGREYTYADYSGADATLARADILVLAHGAKKEQAMAANCDSFLALIERFRDLTRSRRFAPEVWAVGSEIECHPAWGNADLQIYLESKRAFARHARRYFHQGDLLYRHIVPSAFTSPMGKGLISGATAAAWAWIFISRGFRYVPVSYSGIALLNYFKFVFRVHAQPDPSPQLRRVPLVKEATP